MNEDQFDEIIEINQVAWEAAKNIAVDVREGYQTQAWSHLPWQEIRRQLHHNGDSVDLLAVPPSWTGESLQMSHMETILQEAGFKREGNLYFWPS